MGLHDPPGDRQPQPHADVVARRAGAPGVELLPEPRLRLRRDARPGVGHRDERPVPLGGDRERHQLAERILAIEEPAGPEKYNINRDAEITVLLYKERVVKANHSFGKGKLTDKDVDRLVSVARDSVKAVLGV